MMLLAWLVFLTVALSHGAYLIPFVRSLLRHEMPEPVAFVGLSAVIYFDLGMFLECLGFRYRSEFFQPFFEASQWKLIEAVGFIVASPWLIRAGANLVRRARPANPRQLSLRPGKVRVAFYCAAFVLCFVACAIPTALVKGGLPVWESRALLGEMLGPWIILLSVPMYLLAFYVPLHDANRWQGKCVIGALLGSSLLATIAIGERTAILLPVLIVVVFAGRVSWQRWLIFAMAGAVAAACLLPVFKASRQATRASATDLASNLVSADFYRGPELARTVGMSSAFGTPLAYVGSGYIYAALFFVPRALAPFKGKSTAEEFTGAVMQTEPGALGWGFGISAISEALLNGGMVLAPLILLGYGIALGWLSRHAARFPSLQIPLCLASTWLFGYHLPALLMNFGAMALVGLVCEQLFTKRHGNSLACVKAECTRP